MMILRKHLLPAYLLVTALLLFPCTALAAEGSEDRWGLWFGLGRFFNLALVAAVIFWAARKPLANFFANRSESIRRQLAEAQEARLAAEAKLAEIEARMSHLDDEMQAIKLNAEKEAEQEHRRLIAEGKRDAEKVLERARQEIEGMTRAAQTELRKHAAELALQLAEARIRSEISDEDRRRLFDGFVTRVGAGQ